MTKICPIHNVEKIVYGKKSKKYVCKICNKEQQTAWWNKNKSCQQERVKSNRNRLLEFAFEKKKGKKCIICGEGNPLVLEYDHRYDKIDSISELCRRGKSLASIEAEIQKCRILCANCHKIKTHIEQDSHPFYLLKEEEQFSDLLSKIAALVEEDKLVKKT